jgi:hypothetical protein
MMDRDMSRKPSMVAEKQALALRALTALPERTFIPALRR